MIELFLLVPVGVAVAYAVALMLYRRKLDVLRLDVLHERRLRH